MPKIEPKADCDDCKDGVCLSHWIEAGGTDD